MRTLRALGHAAGLAVLLSSFLCTAFTGPAALAAPTVEVVSPQDGAVVTGSLLIEVAYKSDGANPVQKLEIYLNGRRAKEYDVRPPNHEGKRQFRYDFALTAPAECQIAARALDTTNTPGTTVIKVTVRPERAIGGLDIVPPRVDIYRPAQGETVSGELELVADVQDEHGIASVAFYVDGTIRKLIIGSGHFAHKIDTTKLADGRHYARAEAEDQAGNVGKSADRVFIVNNQGEATVAQRPGTMPAQVPASVGETGVLPPPPLPPATETGPGVGLPEPEITTVGGAPDIRVRPRGPATPEPAVRPPAEPQGVQVTQTPASTATGPRASEAAKPELTYGSSIGLTTSIPDRAFWEVVEVEAVRSSDEPALRPMAPAAGLGTPGVSVSQPAPAVARGGEERRSADRVFAASASFGPRGDGWDRLAACPTALEDSTGKMGPASARELELRQPVFVPPESPATGLAVLGGVQASAEPALPEASPRVAMRPARASVDPSLKPEPSTPPEATAERLTAHVAPPPSYTVRAELSLRGAPLAMLPTRERAASLERGRMTVPETGSLAPVAVATSNITDISIRFNGEQLSLRSAPTIINGLSITPLREIFERTDGVLYWYGIEKRVEAINADTRIELKIGDPRVMVNSEETTLVLAPFIKNGRTMVPLEFVAEALNVTVEFDQSTGQILVTWNGF